MDCEQLEAISSRLNNLERENTLLKRAGIISALGLVSWIVLGSGLVKPRKQVVAEEFVLKDRQGTVRARLNTDRNGSPGLALLDRNGKEMIHMRTSEDQVAALDFYDQGKLRMTM